MGLKINKLLAKSISFGEKRNLKDIKYIQIVYTKENETGDNYIESLVSQIGSNYNIRVATSDSLVQLSAIRTGVLRMSARELKEEIATAKAEMRQYYRK